LQELAGRFVELSIQQPAAQMHHGDIHAAQTQAIGGFQSEQTAADDDRVPVLAGGGNHLIGVMQIAIADHARQVGARHGQDERHGSGGQQQAIIGRFKAVGGDDFALDPVNMDDLFAGVQGNAMLAIPVVIVEDDVLDLHFPGQYRREQDAVVIGMGLRAKHRDVILLGRDFQ